MLLIANPRAGRGRDAVLRRLGEALTARGLDHDVVITRGPGHATGLARDAITDGRRFVVAVGGDGTIHEVVNGLVDVEGGTAPEGLAFGAVPAGSGSDFVRTFGLDRAPENLARHLDRDTLYPIDVGRVRLRARDGEEATHLFANIAEAGYGGVVTQKANGYPRWLGKARYLLAIFGAIRSFDLVETKVTVDHTQVEEPVSNIIVANGQFFGGNLKVAPRAIPDDGTFNVQVWRGRPKDVFLKTNKLRTGEHLSDADVREWQSAGVRIEAAHPLVIEADGEVLGTTPATFDLLPKALNLKI
jgi:YegS/Rv2252/BmrU family lipid kinase